MRCCIGHPALWYVLHNTFLKSDRFRILKPSGPPRVLALGLRTCITSLSEICSDYLIRDHLFWMRARAGPPVPVPWSAVWSAVRTRGAAWGPQWKLQTGNRERQDSSCAPFPDPTAQGLDPVSSFGAFRVLRVIRSRAP